MKTRRKFSPVRVMVGAQIASVGLAVWFMFFSTSMSCTASSGMGFTICLIQSVVSCILLMAVLMERKWALVVLPVGCWFMVLMLVFMSVH